MPFKIVLRQREFIRRRLRRYCVFFIKSVAYRRKKATAVLFILCIYAKIACIQLIFVERYYFF